MPNRSCKYFIKIHQHYTSILDVYACSIISYSWSKADIKVGCNNQQSQSAPSPVIHGITQTVLPNQSSVGSCNPLLKPQSPPKCKNIHLGTFHFTLIFIYVNTHDTQQFIKIKIMIMHKHILMNTYNGNQKEKNLWINKLIMHEKCVTKNRLRFPT